MSKKTLFLFLLLIAFAAYVIGVLVSRAKATDDFFLNTAEVVYE